MTDIAVARQRSAVAGSITTTHARPRAFLVAIALAATFAIGLVSGLAVGPVLRTGGEPATVANAAISAQAAGQAHALWLQGELDSYGSAQASPVGSLPNWLAYRQFRLSEEGYTR